MLLTSHKTPWLRVVKNDPFATLRLFCFNYAGAGASAYRSWSEAPFPHVEIAAVQLPGREGRMREESYTSVQPLVSTLARELGPYLGKPFAFFGHSMGALVSFELTRELRRLGMPAPCALFLSGRRGPRAQQRDRFLHHMADEELVAELRGMNGTAEGVMEDAEMLALLLPIFRADFAVCENWRYEHDALLTMPIHVLGGTSDPGVTAEDLRCWSRETAAASTLDIFEGDHFYVHQSRAQLLARVGGYLRQYANHSVPDQIAPPALRSAAK